jgi:multiple sugar transport system ATP-binding protein
MAPVTFAAVGKTYPDGTRALRNFDLQIEDGEFTIFVGPSGCGKTTALRLVAGLEEVTEGELRIGGQLVNDRAPRDRDVAMVFQNYALYPHMSVFENIAFPLRAQGVSRKEVSDRVTRAAKLLGLEEHLKRKPRNLSGGQRQRVAMGRAIVRQPQVFLMDEPLSNLDAKLRVQMRTEIARLQQELGVTTIYVTHDQVEAMTMGDRIAVMRKGVLQQLGPPQTLYDEPANLFVATFIGSPAMNLFRVPISADGGGLTYTVGEQALPLPERVLAARPSLRSYAGREVALGVRPEHVVDAAGRDPSLARLRGLVTVVEALGPERLVYLELEGVPVVTDEVLEIARDVDTTLINTLVEEVAEHHVIAVGRFDPASRVAPGGLQEVVLLPDHLHFFDLDTGASIL